MCAGHTTTVNEFGRYRRAFKQHVMLKMEGWLADPCYKNTHYVKVSIFHLWKTGCQQNYWGRVRNKLKGMWSMNDRPPQPQTPLQITVGSSRNATSKLGYCSVYLFGNRTRSWKHKSWFRPHHLKQQPDSHNSSFVEVAETYWQVLLLTDKSRQFSACPWIHLPWKCNTLFSPSLPFG